MKTLAPLFLIVQIVLFSCSNNSVIDQSNLNYIDFRENSVNICHLNDEGAFQSIRVNSSAVSAHLAHGDYLSDEEGYCLNCTLCDINKITQFDWVAYLNTYETSCTKYIGASIWTDLFLPDGSARGIGASYYPNSGVRYLVSWLPGGDPCFLTVGVDISLEEWESCQAFIRKLISTRPDTPELCDILEGQPNLKSPIIQKEKLKKHSFNILEK